jgi:hypothetical protein
MEDNESPGYDLLKGTLEVLPLLMFIGVAFTAWFTLQGQVIELRARYEASTSSTREALADVKSDIKENTELLRRVLEQDVHTSGGSREATRSPVDRR